MRRPFCRDCVHFDEHDPYACHYEPGNFVHTRPDAIACSRFTSLKDYMVDSRLRSFYRQRQVKEVCEDPQVLDNLLPTLIMGINPEPNEDP